MNMKKLIFFPLFWLSTAGFCADGQDFLVVRPHPVDIGFPVEATVEAVQQSTVGAQQPGRVIEVRADAGQTVKKGELLMRLDAREAAEAARAADAAYVNAKLNYERQQQLKAQKFVSQAAVDKARAEFDAAAANRAAAGASQSHASIVAPIDGVIARRHAELGDMAMPGTPLFTLYQPGKLRVSASIPQYRLTQMRGLQGASVDFPELGKQVSASAVQILPGADAATHASTVRVSLPPLPEIVPGMAARVHFVTGQAEKLTVPASAVVRRGEVAAVYVRSGDGHLVLRQLRLGELLGNGEIEVLAGLGNGEQIATDPVKAAIAQKTGR